MCFHSMICVLGGWLWTRSSSCTVEDVIVLLLFVAVFVRGMLPFVKHRIGDVTLFEFAWAGSARRAFRFILFAHSLLTVEQPSVETFPSPIAHINENFHLLDTSLYPMWHGIEPLCGQTAAILPRSWLSTLALSTQPYPQLRCIGLPPVGSLFIDYRARCALLIRFHSRVHRFVAPPTAYPTGGIGSGVRAHLIREY